MNKIDLKDRVAVVTGGAQGFGLAIVEKFLASHAKVIIWDKDIKLMKSLQLSKNVKMIQVDVTNFENIKEATQQTIQIYDRIDILINFSSIYTKI